MNNIYHIAIEGVIGVGKTSLAERLARKLDARLVLEEFEENPFLGSFYDDRKRYAFQTQLFFLLSRYRQFQDLKQTDLFSKLLVTDYMFQKDRLFAYLNLDENEMGLYDRIAGMMEETTSHPDLVIYLQADTDRLLYNIRKRGRDFESAINADYIAALNQVYNEYFFRYKASPLLIINATDIDFVNDEDDLKDLLATIRQPIEGTKFYNPIKR
ncbi:MAG: deoxynucleoside kinase [Candidatus Marinimicrobia bacterium]|nr:deoxynucleoside kinase [Candidatus Neomarinimicrobiota bacterium]MCF7850551.1 deoxynucleoside kinase [Candidatus Neomarinimicrobiota bacterium]MCF7904125.1 deoxynucleoside kinase [Candidatus Neomarinimicrobiota bacterium]